MVLYIPFEKKKKKEEKLNRYMCKRSVASFSVRDEDKNELDN